MAVDLEYAKRVCGCLPFADADAGVAETQDCMSEMIAELDALRTHLAEAGVSTVPCCECHGPVVEFSRPNAEWNATMRPDGHETDREYLCAACYMGHLAKRADAAESQIAESERKHRETLSLLGAFTDPSCYACDRIRREIVHVLHPGGNTP